MTLVLIKTPPCTQRKEERALDFGRVDRPREQTSAPISHEVAQSRRRTRRKGGQSSDRTVPRPAKTNARSALRTCCGEPAGVERGSCKRPNSEPVYMCLEAREHESSMYEPGSPKKPIKLHRAHPERTRVFKRRWPAPGGLFSCGEGAARSLCGFWCGDALSLRRVCCAWECL